MIRDVEEDDSAKQQTYVIEESSLQLVETKSKDISRWKKLQSVSWSVLRKLKPYTIESVSWDSHLKIMFPLSVTECKGSY